MGQDTIENTSFQDSADEGMGLSEYASILLGKLWLILSIAAITAVCATVYYSMVPDRYATSTKILFEKTDDAPKSSQDINVSQGRMDEDFYGTQIAIMLGPKTSSLVRSETGSIPPGYSVDAYRIKGTRIVVLSVKHLRPDWAADIANKYTEVFIRESGKEDLYVAQQYLKFIPEGGEVFDRDEPGKVGDGLFDKKIYAQSLSAITNDPIIQKMRQEKLELNKQFLELSQKYKFQHPQMVNLKKKQDYVDSEIQSQTEKVLNNLKAKLSGETLVSDIRILEPAMQPKKPSEPDRPKGIFMATLFATLSLSALIIYLEKSNQKIGSEKDLRPDLHIPFLGYVPYVKDFTPKKTGKGKSSENGLISLPEELRRNTMLADALATVRTHILFSMPYEKSKTIMFTSTIPGEGKSTVTALLALSFASLGKKVLLVDADLRKPRLQALFNLSNKNGLTDYLVGSIERKDVVKDIPGVDNLKIITTGSQTPNPSELLGSDRFKSLIEESLKEYDRILVDAPPTLYIPDGLIIAKCIQSGILVCGSGVVTKKVAKIVKEKYDSVHHPFIGVIINRADYQKEAHRFKYFHDYQKHYSIVTKKPAA